MTDLPVTRQCIRCGCPSRLVSERLIESESEHRAPTPPQIGRFFRARIVATASGFAVTFDGDAGVWVTSVQRELRRLAVGPTRWDRFSLTAISVPDSSSTALTVTSSPRLVEERAA
jgi:hypothetical protein